MTTPRTRAVRLVLLALLLLLGAGCRERIQHGLDERAANELQTVLAERGVPARKVAEGGKKPTWSLEVEGARAPDAVRVLAELGLPRAPEETGCDVFGGSALVRTPLEEQVCRVRALERGLEKTLQELDGVLVARVHLVLPAAPRYGQPAPPGKASAMLRVLPGRGPAVRATAASLERFIAGAVEGLAPADVSLLVDEAPGRPVDGGAPPSRPGGLRAVALVLAGLVVGLSLVQVTLALRLRRLRLRLALRSAPSAPSEPEAVRSAA